MLPEFRVATHPGQILLAEFLEPLRLTQAELARATAYPSEPGQRTGARQARYHTGVRPFVVGVLQEFCRVLDESPNRP